MCQLSAFVCFPRISQWTKLFHGSLTLFVVTRSHLISNQLRMSSKMYRDTSMTIHLSAMHLKRHSYIVMNELFQLFMCSDERRAKKVSFKWFSSGCADLFIISTFNYEKKPFARV